MLYFSQLQGKRVATENRTRLGRLTDLVFLAATQPMVTKLVVDGGRNHRYIIPILYLKKINSKITVADGFGIESLSENELYIRKNILDQQIIDIKGNKVVRVNDVAIQDKIVSLAGALTLMIAGVDVGIIGILRWFGIDETFGRLFRLLGKTVTSRFLSWADIQPLALARGTVVLKKEEKKLSRLLPEDLADHLETMSIRNITRVLDLMEEKLAAEVIESLNVTYQQNLFKLFTPERAGKLIARMDPDEAVDILLTLTEKRRDAILKTVPPQKLLELSSLLSLAKTPIGGLITSEFFTASPEETALAIRRRIGRETGEFSALSYIFAINREGQLVGAANLHELLLAAADTPLYRFMTPSVVVLHLTTPVEIAIKRMLKYKIEALPVIDDKKNMLGLVTFDDLAESMLEKFV